VELGNLADEHAKRHRHSRIDHLDGCEDFSELSARHCVGQLDEERLRFFDRGKKGAHNKPPRFAFPYSMPRPCGRAPLYSLTGIAKAGLQRSGTGVGDERVNLARIFAARSGFHSRSYVDTPWMQRGDGFGDVAGMESACGDEPG